MNSMTGYGKGFAEADGRKITVEMKSVNSKNLDLNVRSPKALYFAEDAVRKTVKSFFIHGRIDVFITYENTSDDASGVMVNDALASEYVRIAEYLASEYNLVNDFSVSALMKSPDVISSVETEDDEDALEALVVAATKEAAKGMEEKRGREGLGLYNDFKVKLQNLRDYLAEVRNRAPSVMENYREKLVSRVTRYFEGVDEDAENRLISEISSYADKVCIDEEMQRLGAHIDNFEYNMEVPGAIGSQLNYYTQEMNREANTMGSKANDLGITNLVIAMKSEIEKLREQVQNIE